MDDLLTDFIAETRETLDAIATELVEWEAQPDDRSRLDSIFRFVHTVKGSCGFLDLPRLQRLSHAAEDALAEVRAGKRRADSALVSAVLAVVDRIGELADAMATGDALSDGEDGLLIAALSQEAVAPVPSEAAPTPAAASRGVARSIRLSVDLLDRMMGGVSDMVLARNELARRLRETGADAGTEVAFERLSLCIGEMREAITKSRMARIDALFTLLPRMVRDLAAELGKQVVLEVDGGDVELDREMIEMIRDPLTHIVRNAIDHGIELPDIRRAAGKPAAGRLRIAARQSGNQILIEAIDDGKGIDEERLVAKAIAAGQISPDRAMAMSRAAKLDLIFAPGLSTASEVTEISGRGVGMDVVRANIERIGGGVDLDSRLGQGLRLTIRVPLTLTIIPALTVSVGGQRFAIPRSAIEEIVRVNGSSIRIERIGDAVMALIRGVRLPWVDLGKFLEIGSAGAQTLVVARAGGSGAYALAVDAVHDHEELVVKPATPELMGTGIYAGTTLPDNSRPMLLLDVAGIAAANGVVPQATVAEEVIEAVPVAASVSALLFRELDGRESVVPLALAERIEDVDAAGLFGEDGALRIAHDGRIAPAATSGTPPRAGSLRVLWLDDGAVHLAYGIGAVIDVIDLPAGFDAADTVLIEGRPVRTLDVYSLFAGAERVAPAPVAAPLCLIADGGDPWARQVLAPLLGAAGYRVAFAGDAQASEAAIVIVGQGDAAPITNTAPVLRLRVTPDGANDGAVYRYDRVQLLDAIRVGIGG